MVLNDYLSSYCSVIIPRLKWALPRILLGFLGLADLELRLSMDDIVVLENKQIKLIIKPIIIKNVLHTIPRSSCPNHPLLQLSKIQKHLKFQKSITYLIFKIIYKMIKNYGSSAIMMISSSKEKGPFIFQVIKVVTYYPFKYFIFI